MYTIKAVTDRLILREVTESDAGFICELVNSEGWLRFIGDRRIHDHEAARRFIRNGPMHFYQTRGYGSYCLTLKTDGTPIGMCGLYQRNNLSLDDIGYALLPQYEGNGYISEACAWIIEEARTRLNKPGLLAVTAPDNPKSIRVLEKFGFRKAGNYTFDNETEQLVCMRLDFRQLPEEEPYMIRRCATLSSAEKETVSALWNAEYPVELQFTDPSGFEAYLAPLKDADHFLLCTIDGVLHGWGMTFRRDGQRWFAMLLHRSVQGRKLGTFLLNRIKQDEPVLYGWVIDAPAHRKADGSNYPVPLPFYLKNGFRSEPEVRLELPAFSAQRIVYTREN